MAKTEVTKAETTGVAAFGASAELPDFLRDKMKDDRGNEGVSNDDLTIPRLDLCQSLSECRKKNSPEYIPGIEEGQLYNNITRQIYGDSVLIVPVAFKKEFLLWRDQKLGGGFGGSFDSMEAAIAGLAAQERPDEYEIVDTPQHFVLLLDEATNKVSEAVISMSKSKARVSRKFNSLVRMNEGPRFSRVYRVKGVSDQNSAGQDFYNLAIENVGFVTPELYARAEGLYELIQAGKVQADRTMAETGTAQPEM